MILTRSLKELKWTSSRRMPKYLKLQTKLMSHRIAQVLPSHLDKYFRENKSWQQNGRLPGAAGFGLLNFRGQHANIVPQCYAEGLPVSTCEQTLKEKELGNTLHEPTFHILWVLPASLRLHVCHINRLSFNYFISFQHTSKMEENKARNALSGKFLCAKSCV